MSPWRSRLLPRDDEKSSSEQKLGLAMGTDGLFGIFLFGFFKMKEMRCCGRMCPFHFALHFKRWLRWILEEEEVLALLLLLVLLVEIKLRHPKDIISFK